MKIHLFFTIIIYSPLLFAQQKNSAPTKFDNKNSVQLEAGGHGMIYSLNYERILISGDRFKTAAQVGISYYPPSWGYIELWMPIGINEILSFGNHHVEAGLGIVPVNPHLHSWKYIIHILLGAHFYQPVWDIAIKSPMGNCYLGLDSLLWRKEI